MKLLNLLLLKMLIVEAVESAVEAVESVVKPVDCCRLVCAIVLLKMLNLLLKLLIVIGYYEL